MTAEHILDVSQLEPCEPLERTLAALARLPQGEYLRVLHRMEPHPLYPILAQQGFNWLTRQGEKTPIEILIWHKDDLEAEQQVNTCVK